MKRIGLIAEFNPLHKGHRYYVEEVKKLYPKSDIVAVISGNVVQRGEFSIIDKFTRAEAALDIGIDLVVELPAYYTLNNANIFAKGAIDILENLEVDGIIFGSELNNINKLKEIASKINTAKFQKDLEEKVKKIQSHPKSFTDLVGYNFKSNDILAISYISEIFKRNSEIKVKSIQRNCDFESASKIRKEIKDKNTSNSLINIKNPIIMDKFWNLFKAKLITEETSLNIIKYIQKKIEKENYSSWTELLEKLSNKTFTKARLGRELIKWFIGIDNNKAPIRILASNLKGFKILKDADGYKTGFIPSANNELKIASIIDIEYPGTKELEVKRSIIKKNE